MSLFTPCPPEIYGALLAAVFFFAQRLLGRGPASLSQLVADLHGLLRPDDNDAPVRAANGQSIPLQNHILNALPPTWALAGAAVALHFAATAIGNTPERAELWFHLLLAAGLIATATAGLSWLIGPLDAYYVPTYQHYGCAACHDAGDASAHTDANLTATT